MKFNKIICAALAACMLAAGADALAQTRKTTTRKATGKTAVARKGATAAPRPVTGPALDASKLTGVKYIGFEDFNYNGMWLLQEVELKADNVMSWTYYNEYSGSWSVTGNTLNVKSGEMILDMKSPDGGNYFTGKFSGAKDKNQEAFLYRFTNYTTPVDTAALKKRMLDGKFTAFVSVYSKGQPELGVPAKFKLIPGDNPDEGTYKVTLSHEQFSALGTIKGTYKFDETGFHFTQTNGKDSSCKYEDMNSAAMMMKLGPKSIPGLGSVTLYLYTFFK